MSLDMLWDPRVVDMLFAVVLVVEVVLGAVSGVCAKVNKVQPLWLYPSWLREQRAKDLEWIRAQR